MRPKDTSPIKFNRFKHHLSYLINRIEKIGTANGFHFETLKDELKVIGNSTLDLYTGALYPDEIITLIEEGLIKDERLSINAYRNWVLGLGKDFKMIRLPDDSEWTLRWSDHPVQYIHIHPARYSNHTIRVHANALKTALAAVAWSALNQIRPDLKTINHVRENILSFPPIKPPISLDKGTGKLIKLLLNE